MTFLARALGALMVALLFATPALAQTAPEIDARAFTDAVANFYQRAAPDAEVTVKGPLDLEIRRPKTVQRAALAMLFAQCQRDKSTCAAAADRQARATVSADGVTQIAQLRITVRPSAYVDQLGAGAGEPVVEPLVDDLWIIGVKDGPTTIATLGAKDLAALGLDAAGALKAGERNLEARFRAALDDAARLGEGGVGAVRGDDYVASLIAFPELWVPLAEAFDGNLYVAAPASDIVLYVDAREKDALDAMRRAVNAEMSLAQRPVSSAVLAWSPAGWEVVGKTAEAGP